MKGFRAGYCPATDDKSRFTIYHFTFFHLVILRKVSDKKCGPVTWPTSKAMTNEKCEMIYGK